MKNANQNTSAKRNTLASTVVAMVANGDTITPEHRFKADEIAEQKAKESARKKDLKTGAKNEQHQTGEKKSASTRIKAGKVNVEKLLDSTGLDDNKSWTPQDRANYVRDLHNGLVSGQLEQVKTWAQIGTELVALKKDLLKSGEYETQKQADRAFGEALKKAGIGSDVIPRQTRDQYVWVSENADAIREFVNNAIARFDKDPKKADKLTKSIASKYRALKLSPYIIKSAMEKDPTEKAVKTSRDLAKSYLAKLMDEMTKRESDKLDLDHKDAQKTVLKEASEMLKAVLSEMDA